MSHVARPSYNRFKRRRFRAMSYEQAKVNARALGLKTREQYLQWHHKERPMWIPRYPNRAYEEEWEGWGEFLGTNNTWGEHNNPLRIRDSSKFLSYWEAVRTVQRLAKQYLFTTGGEYMKWHKDNEGKLEIVDRLPRAPQKFYSEWTSWYVWLGKTAEGKLIAAKDAVEHIGILALVRNPSLPQNVATIVKCPDGKSELIEILRRNEWRYVRVYKYNEEDEKLFWKIVNQYTRPFQGEQTDRLCQMGAAPMLSELDLELTRASFP